MTHYIIRRLLQAIPMLFLLSLIMFILVNVAPGGPLAGQGRSRRINPEKVEQLKRQFGLDKPLPVQYVVWLIGNDWMRIDADGDGIADGYGERKGILRGDFGFSFRSRKPVLEEIKERVWNTIYLMSITLLVVAMVAIPIGVISAIKQYSIFDIFATTLSFMGQAVGEPDHRRTSASRWRDEHPGRTFLDLGPHQAFDPAGFDGHGGLGGLVFTFLAF